MSPFSSAYYRIVSSISQEGPARQLVRIIKTLITNLRARPLQRRLICFVVAFNLLLWPGPGLASQNLFFFASQRISDMLDMQPLSGILIQFHGCTNLSWGQSSNAVAQRKTALYTQDDLIQSVKDRDSTKMEFLISVGVSPNAKETTGETALNIAAATDNVDAVLILLRSGAQVNLKGYLEQSSLFHARTAPIAKLLLDAGADLNARDALGHTPLMFAPFQVSKLLIDFGADVSLGDKDGFTALSVTAEYGEKEKVDLLLSNGADVNARAQNGWTALVASGGRSSPDVAETLLQHGADPNAKMDDGVTALMRAATYSSLQTARVLLKFGADPNARMDDGATALSIALASNNRYGSHSQIIELLRKATPGKRPLR